MKSLRDASLLLFLLLIAGFPCSMQTKKTLEIDTNGFLNDNCYQAILVFDPDDGAYGLVARRDSAYLKAKKADLNGLTLEKMIYSSWANKLKYNVGDKYKGNKILEGLTNNALVELRGNIEDG